MAERYLLAAETMRRWRPRLEKINREARPFGVGVPWGMEQVVALRARVHHVAENWLTLTDCSNAFNTHGQAGGVARGGGHLRASTHAVCYGERSAAVFFQTDSGERRNIDRSRGVQHRDTMGPALFCMLLLPVL